MAKAVNRTWILPSRTLSLVEGMAMAVSRLFASCGAWGRTLQYHLHDHFLIIAHLACSRFFFLL